MTNLNSLPEVSEDPRDISEKVLRRDRRRQIISAVIAGFAWLLLAACVVAAAWFVVTYILPTDIHMARKAGAGEPLTPMDMQNFAKVHFVMARLLYTASIVMAVLLVLAAGATLFYVRVSHQASLRRIRFELADVSAQLRSLSRGG